MSDDLVNKLYDRMVCSPAQNSCRNDLILNRAADRIEELEAKLAKLKLERNYANDVIDSYVAQVSDLEANLAKAVEALGRIKRGDFSIMTPPAYVTNPLPSAQEIARTTLAALKGQTDE